MSGTTEAPIVADSTTAEDRSPRWASESIEVTRNEITQWWRTFRAFLAHPINFVVEWSEDRSGAMNPLGFLAASAGVLGIIRSLGLAGIGFERAETLGEQIWESITPFLHYIGLGLLMHVVLFTLCSVKRRWSSTAAVTMFAAGSAGALGEAIAWLIISLLTYAGLDLPLPVVGAILGVALAAFCNYLGIAVGVLYRATWWQVTLAFVVAFVVSGLFFGHFDPPGEYGVHWFLRLFDANGHFEPFLRLGF
jgi:hypothetical protein